MIKTYLGWKNFISTLNDGFTGSSNKAVDIPARDPQQAADALKFAADKVKGWPTPFTGDPLGGAFDFYTHPLRLERAIRIGKEEADKLRIDCDDIALWAAITIRKHYKTSWIKVLTLVDQSITGSHVISLGQLKDGSIFSLDTNGLIWHPDMKLYDKFLVMRKWEKIYKSVKYIDCVETDEPWIV